MNLVNLVLIVVFAYITSGCATKKTTSKIDGTYPSSRCEQPLSDTLADKIVVDKSDRKMYLYKDHKLLGSMRVSLGANDYLGPKVKKGDKRTPVGTYTILNKRCHPVKYMAMTISYPNAKDRARAAKMGVDPGNLITIHGQPYWNRDGHGDSYTLSKDWTDGCIALTNSNMKRLWSMIKVNTPITLRP